MTVMAERRPQVLADGRILCGECGKVIAAWDERRGCIIFEMPRLRVLVEVPGRKAIIQCYRARAEDRLFRPCGYLNRVQVGE